MGNGYIATTSNQKVYTTLDLTTWVQRDSTAPTGGSGSWKLTNGGSRWLLSGAYFNGVTFVPWLGYSDDGGASWQDTGFTAAGTLTIAYGAGTWSAAGGGVIYASADGISWDIIDTTSLSANGYVDQILYDSAFVLVGGDDNGAITMLSFDGRTWNPATPPTGWDEAGEVIAFAGTYFLYGLRDGFATAVFGHSDDLLTWTEDGTFDWGALATDGTTLTNVSYDGSVTTVETSTDGYSWTSGTISDIDFPTSFQYADGLWFGSTNHSFGSPGVFKSTDASTWSTYDATLPGTLPGVITDLKRGVIPYIFSANAVSRRPSSGSFTADAIINSSLMRHTAVGDFYTGSSFINRSITSPVNSTAPPWTTTDIPSTSGFADVTYGNGKWVAVDFSSSIWISTDGQNWDEVPSALGANDGALIAFGNNLFVVWTGNDSAYYSSNVITWAQGRAPDSNVLVSDLVFDGMQFLLVGGYRTGVSTVVPYISASTNGTSWTNYQSPTGTSGYRSFESLAYNGSTWVAILSTATVQRGLGYATSLSSWTVALFTTSGSLNCVAYGNGYWLIGASTGKVYYTTNPTTWNTSNFVAVSTDGIDGLEYSGVWIAFDFDSIYATGSNPLTTWSQVFDETGTSSSIYAIASGQVSQLIRTFTAGAVLAKTAAGYSFGADAVLEKGRFFASAVLRKLDHTVSFTGDAVVGYARPSDITNLDTARNRHDRAVAHFGDMFATQVVHDEDTLLEDALRELWNRVSEYEESSH